MRQYHRTPLDLAVGVLLVSGASVALAALPFAMGVTLDLWLGLTVAVIAMAGLAGGALISGRRALLVGTAIPWLGGAAAAFLATRYVPGALLLGMPGALLLARAAGMFQGGV